MVRLGGKKKTGLYAKKYESGAATNYVTRTQALKKLQLTLKDFRRLCILKGIYPHEPLHKKTVNKGSTQNKTFYYVKDINFLASEPIISKFRDYKIFLRRLTRARAKKEPERVDRLYENKPEYKLDNIVKERYPSFVSAIRDLDDALCLCFLFATLPHTRVIKPTLVQDCRRLTVEFMHYVIAAKALRKVFVSIKGLYYQAEVMGEKVTWIVPHERGVPHVTEVDFSVMATFVEFYTTALGFINFRLFQSIGLHYPPKLQSIETTLDGGMEGEERKERVYSLALPLQKSADVQDDASPDDFPPEEGESGVSEELRAEWQSLQRLKTLFQSCRCFLNREVPKESLTFVLRCAGATVSWADGPGATYPESDQRITHQLVDRPNVIKKHISRLYVQPQWVYDCFNGRRRLPMERYFPEAALPPHLSPFVQETPGDYVPPERLQQLTRESKDVSHLTADKKEQSKTGQNKKGGESKKRREKKEETKEEKQMRVETGQMHRPNEQKMLNEQGQQLRMREMMLAKKHRRVYHKMKRGRKRHLTEVETLKQKRKKIDDAQAK